jgi:hypothetical protein
VANPFDPYRNDQVTISYTSDARGKMDAFVNGSAGQVRRLLDHELQDAGPHTIYWDGRKDDGTIHQGAFSIVVGLGYPIPQNAIFLHRPGPTSPASAPRPTSSSRSTPR